MNHLTQTDHHTHDGTPHSHGAPFWVRHYDKIVNLITFGKANSMYRNTLTLVNLQPGDAILDVGCGTGKLIVEAGKLVGVKGTAVGIDVEPAMIAQARSYAHKANSQAMFEVASIDTIPYPNDSFDVVVSSLVYHHLTEAQKVAGLAEVRRVLKPNGRFLIVDLNPSRRSLATSLPGHNQLEKVDYVSSEVVEQLQKTGFSNIRSGIHPYKKLSYAIGEVA